MSTPQDLAALVAAGRATKADMVILGRERVAAIKTNPDIPQFRVRASDPISVNEDRRTISYIASDETPDRMGDIIRVIEGPLALVPCVSRTAYRPCADCKSEADCAIRHAMMRVRDETARILDGTGFADAQAQDLEAA